MKKKIFIVAAVIFSSQLYGQVFPSKKTKDSIIVVMDDFPYLSKLLDRVVITSNRFPKKQSQTGKVTTVIDKEMLEKMGSRTVGEILNIAAGVTVNGANNTLGTNQRISIRGSSDGNVLLLIDGVPVNDPSLISNYFDLNFISTAQIDQIEILKGGQSTLYGSDAVSGVINIITKKPDNKKFFPSANVSFGSYNTLNSSVGATGQTKTMTYNVFLSRITSNGFSAAYDSAGNKNFDKDGYHQYILGGSTGIKISNKVVWNISGNYSHYKADVDAGAFKDDKDFFIRNKNLQLNSGIQWKQAKGEMRFNYQYNYVNRFYLDDSADRGSFAYYSRSTYTGRTHFTELYENYRWNHVSLLAGVDYRFYNTNQVYTSVSPYGPYSTPELNDSLAKMWQLSPYVSLVYNDRVVNVEAGTRMNHHNIYGNNFTYTFNPSFLIHSKVKLFGNIASAFKTPSLFQLFDPYNGNKDLAPEKTIITEGGFEIYPTGNVRLRLTGFYRKTRNAIQYIIKDPVQYIARYENVNHQQNSGFEFELNYAKEKWRMYVNYTYTKGKVTSAYSESGDHLSSDTTYNNLYRVPDHAFNGFVSYDLNKKINLNCLLKYAGKRWEPVYAAAPKKLDDYFTIDLSGQYWLTKNLKAFADLKNITNRKYFDILGYNSRRFNFAIGLNFSL